MKLFFLWEKMKPKLVVLLSRKKPQVLEINVFRRKKILPVYLRRYDRQNRERDIFLKKWVSRYLSFGDFKIPKNSLQ